MVSSTYQELSLVLPLDAATLVATAAWVAADGGEEAALAALYLLAGEPGLPPPRAAALAAEVPAPPLYLLWPCAYYGCAYWGYTY